jgi:shikimate 5-dehydrogenase
MGLDWCYLAFEVPAGSLDRAIAGAAALGLRGLSVTMPHKDAAARLATRHSRQVRRLGAANTLVFEPGGIRAESCDGDGLLDDLRDGAGFDPHGRRCGVIGAGGAGRATVLALAEAGAAEIVVVNRTATRAWKSVALAPKIAHVGRPEELKGMDLVVKATPTGMPGKDATAEAGSRFQAGPSGSSRGVRLATSTGRAVQGQPLGQEAQALDLVPERGVLGVFGFRRSADTADQSALSTTGRQPQPIGARGSVTQGGPEAQLPSAGSDAIGAVVAGVDSSWFGPGQLVVDLVYDPVRTPFLLGAEQHGAAVRSGLGMLVHQAARQIVFWTGTAPPLDVMWNIVRDRLA